MDLESEGALVNNGDFGKFEDGNKASFVEETAEMDIDDYYTTHLNTEENTEEEDNEDVEYESNEIEICENTSEDDLVFPVISEPLRTFVTINPATLEDEELWSLGNLKSLCEYIGLSVSGNRKSILNRLQNWNGAPLSGAGHPDSYDTRSGRFHTIPMAYLDERNGFRSPKEAKEVDIILDSINRSSIGLTVGESSDGGSILPLGGGLHSDVLTRMNRTKAKEDRETVSCNESEGTVNVGCGSNTLSSLNRELSTPVKSRNNVSSLSSSGCRAKTGPKSVGRICFSPYNHVRVFVSNPGERELNVDPSSILRLGYGHDYDDNEYGYEDSDYLEERRGIDEEFGVPEKDIQIK